MKFIKSLLTIAALMTFCFTATLQAQDAAKPSAAISWTSTTIDFGKIEQGKPVTAEFLFQNPSLVPLIIGAVRPTCGCTVADYTKEPVQPGKSGKIGVTYNAASSGPFTKSILVSTNADEANITLIIKGEVVARN